MSTRQSYAICHLFLIQSMGFIRLKSVLSKSRSSSPSSSPMIVQSEYEEPPLTPLHLHGYKNTTKHRLLTNDVAEELRQHLPSLLQIGHDWNLQYSLEQNGASLNTLYNRTAPKVGENVSRRRGYILVIQDSHRNIFGAYLDSHLKPLDRKYYYGGGDCFLWKLEHAKVKQLTRSNSEHNNDNDNDNDNKRTEDNARASCDMLRLKVFPYTGLNDFVIYSNNDFISVGSGDGKFGLWIDSNLETGASDPVDTFGNEKLSRTRKFHIVGVEVWKV